MKWSRRGPKRESAHGRNEGSESKLICKEVDRKTKGVPPIISLLELGEGGSV